MNIHYQAIITYSYSIKSSIQKIIAIDNTFKLIFTDNLESFSWSDGSYGLSDVESAVEAVSMFIS